MARTATRLDWNTDGTEEGDNAKATENAGKRCDSKFAEWHSVFWEAGGRGKCKIRVRPSETYVEK